MYRRQRERANHRQTWRRQIALQWPSPYQAVLQGHNVQYLEADGFFNRYALSPTAQHEARLRAILETDLLVQDDLFLSRTVPEAAGALP